ncbi:hypothetical protein BLA60_04275 [Actinophytocola xinjiangensis]|uniref:Uncharacterized protein n=1 Tax=Actinophytocola xinjiangensis TaxID=485602 RepID=A0A7Z1B1K0_9PSEU|nr:hypothetical protein [Actinophytocola xinjiangensis]OLF14351.1 hypothetical protein BLA60_04275 [Actinophytocola xinjiangensis]
MTTTQSTAARPRREVIGAWVLLAGYVTLLCGLMWDAQWHNDVGPDNFFTAPHLLLYSGTTMMGLACLTVVLLTTRSAPDRPAVTVFGFFRAPLPFLVGGIGASGNLAYGAADLWWHDVYGFDIALGTTPSHVGLVLSIFLELVGVVMAFAASVRTRSERWGFVAACAVAAMGSTQLASSLSEPVSAIVPSVAPSALIIGAEGALILGLAAGVLRSSRWLVASGLVFVALQGFLVLFSPAATRWYADAIGQPMRDYATNLSPALLLPVTFPVAALLAAGAVRYARRRPVHRQHVMAVLGGLVSVTMSVLYLVVAAADANVVVTLVATAVLGAVTGWAGWRLAGSVGAARLAEGAA